MNAGQVLDSVREIAESFATDRHDRQRRRELDQADFDQLAEAGFLLTGVPSSRGGLFGTPADSTRAIAEVLRELAHGDASVALVSSMHPSVLSFWNATPSVPPTFDTSWAEQSERLTTAALEGSWFGTITSEPGSGGDIANTRATASPTEGGYGLSGQKHFGSGSGITSFMLTAAIPDGETEPDWFVLDVRDVPWDGSRGVTLTAPWDGHGMTATQSHGMLFEGFPATRAAWPGNLRALADAAGPFVGAAFTAVILGIVETAMAAAREQFAPRADALRPYEHVEWLRAEQEAWLLEQTYEGVLRAIEAEAAPLRTSLLGKAAAAELAEDCMRRITRILGGGTFARHSPFGFWFEDVRALGFLRPSWGLLYDGLHASDWPASAQ